MGHLQNAKYGMARSLFVSLVDSRTNNTDTFQLGVCDPTSLKSHTNAAGQSCKSNHHNLRKFLVNSCRHNDA